MRNALLLATIVVLLMAGSLSTGCSLEKDIEQRREESRDAYAPEVAKEWENATGEKLNSGRMVLTTGELSESHSVMASMILMGNGMDSDLSKYGEVSVMDFTDASGTKRAALVVDGKVVLPKAAGAQESPTGEITP